jgi:hypothetical protein
LIFIDDRSNLFIGSQVEKEPAGFDSEELKGLAWEAGADDCDKKNSRKDLS